MHRRSFLMTLAGGFAAAGFSGIAAAEVVEPKLSVDPHGKSANGDDTAPAEVREALDRTDAEFTRRRYRRRYYRRYYRPRYYYRRRYYYRPRYYHRRRYYHRPRYYYRRYW
jgi:hypothetical protein